MSDAPKGKGSEVGLAICAEIIEQLRAIEGVAGIHIMAIEWEQKVREIVQTREAPAPPGGVTGSSGLLLSCSSGHSGRALPEARHS